MKKAKKGDDRQKPTDETTKTHDHISVINDKLIDRTKTIGRTKDQDDFHQGVVTKQTGQERLLDASRPGLATKGIEQGSPGINREIEVALVYLLLNRVNKKRRREVKLRI